MDLEKTAKKMAIERFHYERLRSEKLFVELSREMYIAISTVLEFMQRTGKEVIFLNELAQFWDLPMNQISQIVQKMEEKGLITWELAQGESRATYIRVTPCGVDKLESQNQRLIQFYKNVINQLGDEQVELLIDRWEIIDGIMAEELRKLDD